MIGPVGVSQNDAQFQRTQEQGGVGVDKLECGRTATLLHNHVVIRTFVS